MSEWRNRYNTFLFTAIQVILVLPTRSLYLILGFAFHEILKKRLVRVRLQLREREREASEFFKLDHPPQLYQKENQGVVYNIGHSNREN